MHEKVVALVSNEMALLFRISELEVGHSAALLQLQSVTHCEADIQALKAELLNASMAANESAVAFEKSKEEFEGKTTSLQETLMDLRGHATKDKARIKDLVSMNARCKDEIKQSAKASEDLKNENRRLEGKLKEAESWFEARDELEAMTKELQDLKELWENSEEVHRPELEELIAQKNLLDKQNSGLLRQI